MTVVNVRWNGKRQFVGWEQAGHGIVMDAKPENLGEATGPRPIELVLYALGACTGMDVISIVEKQRQDVTGFELRLTSEQRGEHPKIYEHIEIEYVFTGHSLKPEGLRRAIELSEDKYCAVKGMLGPHVQVTTSFQTVEA